MKIAFVHEYLNQFGGAERMLQVLCALFPEAPIYTLIYDRNATGGVFDDKIIHTSFLQKMPLAKKYHRAFPLLMPLAMEQFDFSGYDSVVSVSASFAKGILTKPGTKHICYCLTPPRFLWDDSQKFVEEFGYSRLVKKFLPPFITYLRMWDQEASRRVDDFWAISDFIKDRIDKYYRRPSTVIYPPVNINKFKIGNWKLEIGNYYLMVGRLVSYKRFDLAVRVFSRLGLPLKIVGIGPEFKKLRSLASGGSRSKASGIEFLGQVSDDRLVDLYAGSRALIFPQEEDFGIVPLESMASGKPVIAYRAGGALETVEEGKTGIFFDQLTEDSLMDAVRRFEKMSFDPKICRIQAEKFDVAVFKENILKHIKP
ncbi:MAG: glycosyltransferase [Candidatus Yanofskybacteria bacterium]|nr:glycosyltransferase [Candidatus Yanofskybacteria bacterium]